MLTLEIGFSISKVLRCWEVKPPYLAKLPLNVITFSIEIEISKIKTIVMCGRDMYLLEIENATIV